MGPYCELKGLVAAEEQTVASGLGSPAVGERHLVDGERAECIVEIPERQQVS